MDFQQASLWGNDSMVARSLPARHQIGRGKEDWPRATTIERDPDESAERVMRKTREGSDLGHRNHDQKQTVRKKRAEKETEKKKRRE